jgi:hypothetical protein
MKGVVSWMNCPIRVDADTRKGQSRPWSKMGVTDSSHDLHSTNTAPTKLLLLVLLAHQNMENLKYWGTPHIWALLNLLF